MIVAQESLSRAGQGDPAGFQDIGAVGDPERLVDVLFHEEYRHALPVDLLDDVEDEFYEERGQAEGGLVEEEEFADWP